MPFPGIGIQILSERNSKEFPSVSCGNRESEKEADLKAGMDLTLPLPVAPYHRTSVCNKCVSVLTYKTPTDTHTLCKGSGRVLGEMCSDTSAPLAPAPRFSSPDPLSSNSVMADGLINIKLWMPADVIVPF